VRRSLEQFGTTEILTSAVKGVPPGATVTVADLWTRGWNVLRGDTATPVAVLRRSALSSNIATMREFCERSGVSLAPHAKTTLSPQVLALQLEAGAWALTVAVPSQVALLWSFGVRRVLLANELVDETALAWVAGELRDRPDRDLLCYVDSLVGVERAERAFAAAGSARRLHVMVELGHAQGRTGVRTRAEAVTVAEAVAAAPHLALVGVAGYEGTITADPPEAARAPVEEFLGALGALALDLHDRGLFDPDHDVVVSAGGSTWFDRVAAVLSPLAAQGMRVVLRSGCYVTHDSGLYARTGPSTRDGWELAPFVAALEVWTRVVSRPEPGLALLNAGRRDLSHDAGLPRPLAARTPHGDDVDVRGATVSALADQHAFLRIDPVSPLAVGDLVGLGISHPCTTLDRWPLLLLVDDDYTVTGGARTYF